MEHHRVQIWPHLKSSMMFLFIKQLPLDCLDVRCYRAEKGIVLAFNMFLILFIGQDSWELNCQQKRLFQSLHSYYDPFYKGDMSSSIQFTLYSPNPTSGKHQSIFCNCELIFFFLIIYVCIYIFIYWSVVELQCLKYMASTSYTYKHILLLKLFSIIDYNILTIVPCAIQ